jgi:hypothetical protein
MMKGGLTYNTVSFTIVCKKIIFRCFGVPTINEFAGGMILRPFWAVPRGNIGQWAIYGLQRHLHFLPHLKVVILSL